MRYVELFKGRGKDVRYIAGHLSKEEVVWYMKQGYKKVSGNNVNKNGFRVIN